MRRLFANTMLAGLCSAVPLWAFGQATMPVIPPVQPAHAKAAANGTDVRTSGVPVWEHDGNRVILSTGSRSAAAVPNGAASAVEGRTSSAGAGLSLTTKPGITAHANVREIRWVPMLPDCTGGTAGMPTCLGAAPFDGVQRGEIGAGFARDNVKLDLSVGHAQSDAGTSPALQERGALPRVLPAAGGADVAAPLWFRNSTSTSVSARGQVSLTPDTSVDVGASLGRVRLLPGPDATGEDTFDQTTLSLGIQHGAVRGAIVGHVLEPNLPGAAFDRNQRWSGIDLGISVRLPWRGELNFGAQNVWTSGHAPALFGPGNGTPDQGRVPYVQYHQDL